MNYVKSLEKLTFLNCELWQKHNLNGVSVGCSNLTFLGNLLISNFDNIMRHLVLAIVMRKM